MTRHGHGGARSARQVQTTPPAPAAQDAYPPIGYHGIIGDTHTACLVGRDGAVDWYCYPHFDSPPLFAALLDARKGGRFTIQPRDGTPLQQLYLPDTNVLLTRLLGKGGALEITDFTPVRQATVSDETAHWHGLVREVRAVAADVPARLECRPTFDHGRIAPEITLTERGARFDGPGIRIELVSPVPLRIETGGPGKAGVVAEFTSRPDEPLWFVLTDPDEGDPLGADPRSPAAMERLLTQTLFFWRAWAERCGYKGRWRERVLRSALTLKLLTFSPTGAIVAAPTTSLPETLGGERNWDYRFTWLRDAPFTLRALFRLGYHEEGRAFFAWLADRLREAPRNGAPIQPLYGIDGRLDLPEHTLDHLEGYAGSRPVRIGNAAYRQLQLDLFGEVLETVYDYAERFGAPRDVWPDLVPLVDWLAAHWHEPDQGIWEVRVAPQHFVYSKIMCWVAFDRAIRLAEEHGLPGDVARWRKERDAARSQVLAQGVHPTGGHFTQSYGSEALDAANLLIPLYRFLPPDDARVTATLRETLAKLTTGDLVHRYGAGTRDGLTGEEGAFSLCFFWLVDNLVLQGELDHAWLLYEKFLTYGNHLGLYAEEIGLDGQLLGNFPQAFTHIGLIYSALLLDTALGQRSTAAAPRDALD